MSRKRSEPSSARVLTQWVDADARERGLPPKRVRDWISFMILGGRLERARSSAEGDLVSALREALDRGYQGFVFRVKGEPYVMPNDSVRVDVALEYRGRGWGTIQVDLSAREGDSTEVEMVEPLSLEPFGLDTPDVLPCLSLRFHIAQKIHAMTKPPVDEGTPNERFRDLVDLLLMRELTH